MSVAARRLADSAARHTIEYRLDSTLFVEAGAGSGKTTALVSRIVQLLRSGACGLEDLAAITFTEAAALELKVRVRSELTSLANRGRDGAERRRVQDALEHLDEAAISTIHGFCQRLLAEHPIEAGLPPRIEILDEVRQSLAWREHWSAVLDRLGEDEGMRQLFGVASVVGVTPAHLQDLAKEVSEEWDGCATAGPDVPAVLATVAGALDRGTADVLASLEAALALEPHCTDPGDALLVRLREASDLQVLLSGSDEDEDEGSDGGRGGRGGRGGGGRGTGGGVAGDPRLAVLAAPQPSLRIGNAGQKGAWTCDVDEVRGHLSDAREARSRAVAEVADAVLPALVVTFDVVAREAAAARRAAGSLAFHDLLVLARDLLAENPGVLARVRGKLRYLLIDEFQDTDPLQLEIAELIGGTDAGRLFFVGDPKQSIYRFRGADLAAYEVARARLADGGPVALTSNFRSVPGILEFANECFTSLMGDSYSRLEPVRPSTGPRVPVRIAGGELDGSLKRHDQRVVESEACAMAIDRAVNTEGWLVGDGDARRPARLSDVAILVPRRTGLAELEAALDAHGIGYRVESASLIYRSQEVRDLLALCRAIDDPADRVALLAALRSPAFACRDDELYGYRCDGGAWSVEERLPAGEGGEAHIAAAGVVADSLSALRGYRARRFELGPVGVLEAAVRDRRLLQLAVGSPRERESWRRVRFLIERARAFVDAGGGGLRAFADWVEEQLSEGLRSVESILPEPDEEVVHILTVHAAKGLEFPIAVLAGFGTSDDVPRGVGRKVLRAGDRRPEVHLRADLRTAGVEVLKSAEQALERAEAVRVLYVAATRARDHLVVCAHHVPATGDGTLGQRLYEAATEALERVPGLWEPIGAADILVLDAGERPDPAATLVPATQASLFDVAAMSSPAAVRRAARRTGRSPADWHAWHGERIELLERIGRRRSVRATEVAALAGLGWEGAEAGPQPEGAIDEEGLGADAGAAGRRRGRGGTQLGRAVHAVLQSVGQDVAGRVADGVPDGADLSELRELAAAQAGSEGIGARAGEVEELVAAALSSPTVKAAFRSGSPRREVYVATMVGGVVLDGYVDICFEDDGGLVVIDYKTDSVRDQADVFASAERYSLQAAAYALALADATGMPVRRCVLVFLAPPGRPIEFDVPGLEAAVARVRAAVAAA
jgi:ATP-dependent exoDNAse (exonuclease V) beta subunit